MTKCEIRLQKKLTALNKIRKLYSKNPEGFRHEYWDEPIQEQRDEKVREIIEELQRDLYK